MPSNQGRDIEGLLDIVDYKDITEITETLWLEVSAHPAKARCDCPAIEALCRLRELGYTITKEDPNAQP